MLDSAEVVEETDNSVVERFDPVDESPLTTMPVEFENFSRCPFLLVSKNSIVLEDLAIEQRCLVSIGTKADTTEARMMLAKHFKIAKHKNMAMAGRLFFVGCRFLCIVVGMENGSKSNSMGQIIIMMMAYSRIEFGSIETVVWYLWITTAETNLFFGMFSNCLQEERRKAKYL
mmetsp:Transcript_1886/g.4169  ORF Transcript_1886/g.4169 Transcript_1886/m.4169 type:complete len:173 (+) Transcript_1886:773-1291(+)